MAKLTVRAIETAKAQEKSYYLTVDNGLYLRVSVKGEKQWLVKYTVNKKRKEIRLALYGKGEGFMSLAEAVAENARIQALARQDIDFIIADKEKEDTITEAAQAAKTKNKTFNDMFTVWLDGGVARQNNNAELIRTFEKDVLPFIGEKPVRTVTEHDLRAIYREILSRGTALNTRERTLVILSNDIRQLFSWAEQRQPWRGLMPNGNPALLVDVPTLLSPDYQEERERVLSDIEIRTLSRLIKEQEALYEQATNKRTAQRAINPRAQCAVWLCLSTLCRIGELLMARWEHIDFENRIWFIPRENVKSTRGKKNDHYIHLSDFSLKQFKRLQALTDTEWCFPSKNKTSHVCVKSVSKIIGDRQIKFKDRKPDGLKGRRNDNTLVIGEEEWTPHDMRRTGATIMQRLGVNLDVIDRCQNHIIQGPKTRRHYMKHDYAKEKKAAFKKLGTEIKKILTAKE